MKKILFTIMLFSVVACGSLSAEKTENKNNSLPPSQSKSPEQFCQSVGGKVKTIKNSQQAFCLLPSGDVVKLDEFYNNNKH